MPDLAQTLRVAGSVQSQLFDFGVPEVTYFPGTVATMKDGSDSTGSRLFCNDQTNVAPGVGPSGEYREDWVLDPATALEPYSFVRIVVRIKQINGYTPPVGATATASYRPMIAGVPQGIGTSAPEIPITDTRDFATDPADGMPWTAAKVNAQRWGWQLIGFLVNSMLDQTLDVMVLDYRVEIWTTPVSEPTPGHELGPYTQLRLADEAGYWGGRRRP